MKWAFWIACGIIGLMSGMKTSEAMLQTHVIPPAPIIIRETVAAPAPKPMAMDSVVKLYGPDGQVLKEYTGFITGIEQNQGGLRFKLENGRTVVLGGSFSVEEIPHQVRGQ
jgi:hypothetical protein